MQTDLHLLWDMYLWVRVSTFLQHLFQDLGCTTFSFHRWAQDTYAAVLDHGVSEAAAQQGICPSAGPCLQEQLPTIGDLSPWWAQHQSVPGALPSMQEAKTCRKQGPETQKVQVHLQTKVQSPCATSQKPREAKSLYPVPKSRDSFCPLLV